MAKNCNLGNSFFGKVYLLIYNLVQFLGWAYCFYYFLLEFKTFNFNNKRLYTNIQFFLTFFQTLQLIEVLHCIIGLVPSNPIITFQQIISRILIVWAILAPFPSTRSCFGVFLIAGSWSLAEITRYLYYATNILKQTPYILTWCRYSFFLVLYPSGVTGELWIIWSSLKEVSTKPYLNFGLPNNLNVSFYLSYVLIGIMLLYIPLFPPMYFHLVNQRNKIIGGQTPSKSKVN